VWEYDKKGENMSNHSTGTLSNPALWLPFGSFRKRVAQIRYPGNAKCEKLKSGDESKMDRAAFQIGQLHLCLQLAQRKAEHPLR